MQIQDVLEQILKIEQELEQLNGGLLDWAEKYQGNDFLEQIEMAVCLENKVQAVTHEIASEIGFIRNDIELIVSFIEFRKRWSQFSDVELSTILDSDMVPLTVKKNLVETMGVSVGKNLKELRLEWNKVFSNMSYSKVKMKISLN